jgi:serine/threonine protein kinase
MEHQTLIPGTDAAAATTIIHGRYEVERERGRGGMGVVYLVRDLLRDGQRLALKSVSASELGDQEVRGLKRESLVLATLRHPGLARVYDFGQDRQSSDVFFT